VRAAGLPAARRCRPRRILSYTHASGWEIPQLLDAIDAQRERGFLAVRAQSGVPGLDTVYGVTKSGSYEPAGRGTAPQEEVWDTEAYLRHAPTALAAARAHVGSELKLLPRRPSPAHPGPGRPARQGAGTGGLYWLEGHVTPPRTRRCCATSAAHTTVPLADRRGLHDRLEFQQLITEQLIDFVARVSHAGGISHLRRIAALAEIGRSGWPPTARRVSPVAMERRCTSGSAPNVAIQEYMATRTNARVFRHA